ncbi:MAG: HAD-IA family hydrolase [Candidatus Bathyarchaeota archaeon]|nr:HAD-IA family hydrolase [Candidatus Bathyarchaeota archaeon]
MIEAVIFDLDGTLIQLPIDYQKMYATFSKIMEKEQIRPLLETVAKLDKKTKEQIFRAWDNAELEVAEKITLNKEGISLYYEYADKPKALVTMQGKAIVKIVIDQYRLCFDFVATREDSLNRAEQLRIAAKKLETPIDSVLFVGNTEGDAMAAEKVGCQFQKIS